MMSCELCEQGSGEVLYRNEQFRIVLIDDPDYPGFCRVIWNDHVKEMSDLSAQDRSKLMAAVWQVESVLRELMQPDKINLASLGNMTPHLHWHVIPRFADDAHFPSPVWAQAKREPASSSLEQRKALLPHLRKALVRSFA
jgi:diadenosine tetraphosphate (Ap4A) HIT family hydrolase